MNLDYTVRVDVVQVFDNGTERVISRYEGSDYSESDAAFEIYDVAVDALKEAETA